MSLQTRLLIAEDDPVSRSFLEQALAPAHAVESVADGAAALQVARQRRFDLLLFDLNLPSLSGIALLSTLRGDPAAASADSPALALTADADPQTTDALRAAGFAAVLGKPVAVATLRQAVVQVLAGTPGALHAGGLPATTAAPAGARAPDWDDAQALRAANHDRTIVAALRALLLQELPAHRERIEIALAEQRDDAVRGELHRLRAAAGFCGAARLADAVDQLGHAVTAGAPPAIALRQLVAAIEALQLSRCEPR